MRVIEQRPHRRRDSASVLPFPHDEPIAVLGWPETCGAALAERPDLDVVVIRPANADAGMRSRLARRSSRRAWSSETEAMALGCTHLLVEAIVASPTTALVPEGVADLRWALPDAECWLVVPVDRLLPDRMFAVVQEHIDEDVGEIVAVADFTKIAGPGGLDPAERFGDPGRLPGRAGATTALVLGADSAAALRRRCRGSRIRFRLRSSSRSPMRRTVNLRVQRRKSTLPAVSRTTGISNSSPKMSETKPGIRINSAGDQQQCAVDHRPGRNPAGAEVGPDPPDHADALDLHQPCPEHGDREEQEQCFRNPDPPRDLDEGEQLDDRDDHHQREKQEHALEGTPHPETPKTRLRPPARGAARVPGRRDRGACGGRRSCPSRVRAGDDGCS